MTDEREVKKMLDELTNEELPDLCNELEDAMIDKITNEYTTEDVEDMCRACTLEQCARTMSCLAEMYSAKEIIAMQQTGDDND